MEELVNIDNNPGTVEDEEGNNDAEENKEKVDFVFHFLLRSKSLNFYIFEITNNSDIENKHGKEWHDGREGDAEVGLIHLDIALRGPELGGGVMWDPILPYKDSVEEPGDVGDDADEGDWEDIEPGLPCMWGKLQWVTNAKKPLDRDCECHENAATHTNVAEGMDEEREEEGEDAAPSIESSAGVVDSTADDEDGVIAGEGEEELVKTVLELGPHEDNNGEDVANDPDKSKDGDKNTIKVVSKVLDNGHGDIAGVWSTIQHIHTLVHLRALKIEQR